MEWDGRDDQGMVPGDSEPKVNFKEWTEEKGAMSMTFLPRMKLAAPVHYGGDIN